MPSPASTCQVLIISGVALSNTAGGGGVERVPSLCFTLQKGKTESICVMKTRKASLTRGLFAPGRATVLENYKDCVLQ